LCIERVGGVEVELASVSLGELDESLEAGRLGVVVVSLRIETGKRKRSDVQ
jgi:RNA-binding protein YlmH